MILSLYCVFIGALTGRVHVKTTFLASCSRSEILLTGLIIIGASTEDTENGALQEDTIRELVEY